MKLSILEATGNRSSGAASSGCNCEIHGCSDRITTLEAELEVMAASLTDRTRRSPRVLREKNVAHPVSTRSPNLSPIPGKFDLDRLANYGFDDQNFDAENYRQAMRKSKPVSTTKHKRR
jgi:hypothetical protein